MLLPQIFINLGNGVSPQIELLIDVWPSSFFHVKNTSLKIENNVVYWYIPLTAFLQNDNINFQIVLKQVGDQC